MDYAHDEAGGKRMRNPLLIAAALSGFIAVAFGAFATHALKNQLTAQHLEWIDIGWRYQVFHTLALLVLGSYVAVMQQLKGRVAYKRAVDFIGVFWVIGILCFSFTLYAMAAFDTRFPPFIVPFGGTSFLIGWVILLVISLKKNAEKI